MQEDQELRWINWDMRLKMLKMFLLEKSPYSGIALQPPRDHRMYKLTFLIRKGDGVILGQKQNEEKRPMFVITTSKYNVLSYCAGLKQMTYAINAIDRIIQKGEFEQMQLYQFCETFKIHPRLPLR